MQKVDRMKEFVKGIFKENPAFVLILGMCPTLAVTTQTINGLAMGVAVIFVLVMSNLLVSLVRDFIPSLVRIPAYIMIIASFVTLVQLVLKAFAPGIDKALGIFIPLIVVNCIILGRAEAFASKNDPLTSVLDGLGMGIGFTLSLTLIAVIREFFGSGTITLQFAGMGWIFNFAKPVQDAGVVNVLSLLNHPASVLILPPGGFLVMGLLLAWFQQNKNVKAEKEKQRKIAEKKAAAAAKAAAAK